MEKNQSKPIISIRKMMVGRCEHEVKVTYINKGWNIRVFLNGVLNQECRVLKKNLIGWAAQGMLRIEDKCGNLSKFASRARMRRWEKERNERK